MLYWAGLGFITKIPRDAVLSLCSVHEIKIFGDKENYLDVIQGGYSVYVKHYGF